VGKREKNEKKEERERYKEIKLDRSQSNESYLREKQVPDVHQVSKRSSRGKHVVCHTQEDETSLDHDMEVVGRVVAVAGLARRERILRQTLQNVDRD
jgi:hypothetical protein